MDNLPFAVVGHGGHSKVVIAALKACHKDIYVIFEDDEIKIKNASFFGIRVQKTPELKWWDHNLVNTIIAIGSNNTRLKIAEKLDGIKWGQVIHPTAIIHDSAVIGKGVYIGANVVIQPEAVIADHSIINTGAIIEHDVVIGSYCHVAPGSIVTGHVRIGTGAFIGAGTIVIPEITIGSWCTIGAGSVVVRNIPDFKKAYGNPCKIIY